MEDLTINFKKKLTIKKLILMVLCFTLITNIKAQTEDPVRIELNQIFQNINKNLIPTGYLDEYGAQFSNKSVFNGLLSDYNVISGIDNFRFIYNDIYTAKIFDAAPLIPNISAVNDALDAATQGNVATPLAIFIGAYSTLKETAIQDGLFTYNANQIFDVEGRTQSPYINNNIFMAVPIDEYAIGRDNTISLSITNSLQFSNTGKMVSDVYIDFLDGNGYQLLRQNDSISKTYTDNCYLFFPIHLIIFQDYNYLFVVYQQHRVYRSPLQL